MKAEIPHEDDHVGKLQNVGAQTQGKLTDIAAAAAAAGVYDLQPPENNVVTGARLQGPKVEETDPFWYFICTPVML